MGIRIIKKHLREKQNNREKSELWVPSRPSNGVTVCLQFVPRQTPYLFCSSVGLKSKHWIGPANSSMVRGINNLFRSEQTQNRACASYIRICSFTQLLQANFGTLT
jgi:hypothetical protein